MKIINTIADYVMRELPYNRSDTQTYNVLRSKSPRDLLILYLNWRNRLISAQRRTVMRSSEFEQNATRAARSAVIEQIISDIEKGNDLNKYLSRRIKVGFELEKKKKKEKKEIDIDEKEETYNLSKFQHLDLLLNDWNIHHLHVSTENDDDGFVKRSDPLLFVMFRTDKAYILEIGTHNTFADSRLAEIAITNWPDDALFPELKGITAPRRETLLSTEDRKKLRNAGMVSLIQVENHIFAPSGGLSTAGTSAKASHQSFQIMRTLKSFEEQILADASPIIELLRRHGAAPSNRLEFEFTFFEDGFGVIEKTSGVPIRLR